MAVRTMHVNQLLDTTRLLPCPLQQTSLHTLPSLTKSGHCVLLGFIFFIAIRVFLLYFLTILSVSREKKMDGEFWAARLHRHIPSVQSSRLNRSGIIEEEDDDDDDVRTWFPCPFCYLEIELQVLPSHLQQEHCFDSKNAVCPICASSLGKDVLNHFTVQHAHLIKRQRKSQKSGFWSNNATANIIRDLRELSSFLGGNNAPGNGHDLASDPILSPFLCTGPVAVPRDNTAPCIAEPCNGDSNKMSTASAGDRQDYEERGQRAAFLQELLLSTVF